MNAVLTWGRCQRVPSGPRPALLPRRPHKGGKRSLSAEDVRAIRWWAATTGKALSISAQARTLATLYPVRQHTIEGVITRDTFAAVTGLPLSARYWTSTADQQLGLLYWLVWMLWIIRQRVHV